MAITRHDNLKPVLDQLYATFDFAGTIARDPIEFPHSYERPEDREISGFISASFAYGSVSLFKAVLRTLFSRMGASPYDFIINFDPQKESGLFSGVKYRFNENKDIMAFFHILGITLREHGSIQQAFRLHYSNDDLDIGNALSGLVDSMLITDTSVVYGRNIKPAGLQQLMTSPARGSACKRMNLFLRWMIRDKDIDFGIWKGIPKKKLVIPLDTHIARIAKCLGLTDRASADWKMAVEITNSLKELDTEDPLKYDFALCHQGISGLCSAKKCDGCRLFITGLS
jgi:uncharacterized protein (TIGR02757 family)